MVAEPLALSERIRVTGYRPEVAVQIISMMAHYFLNVWGNDIEFRKRLTNEIQEFLVELDNPRNGVVCAWDETTLIGAVAIDALKAETEGARIRWFIVDDKYKGQGYGRFLFERALDYCQQRGFDRVTLCTFKEKDAAIALYKQCGFTAFKEQDVSTSQTKITELWFEKLI
jgi:GNAT superfamily N-acetyltransferase